MRVELPLVVDCGGCGRCCDAIGMPPFEAVNPDTGIRPIRLRPGFVPEAWDADIFRRMPRELRKAHAEAVLALVEDPTRKPCLWLDSETKRCRHYEWRPTVCRVFKVGGEICGRLLANPTIIMQSANNNDPRFWRDPSDGGRWGQPNLWHERTGWRGWVGRYGRWYWWLHRW